jgi:pyruvate dehydrogenase (quinone)
VASTVADHGSERSRACGEDTVLGYVGDGIDRLLARWGCAEDGPRFVRARHQELATLDAAGRAEVIERFGVGAATPVSGVIRLSIGTFETTGGAVRLDRRTPGNGTILRDDAIERYRTVEATRR